MHLPQLRKLPGRLYLPFLEFCFYSTSQVQVSPPSSPFSLLSVPSVPTPPPIHSSVSMYEMAGFLEYCESLPIKLE